MESTIPTCDPRITTKTSLVSGSQPRKNQTMPKTIAQFLGEMCRTRAVFRATHAPTAGVASARLRTQTSESREIMGEMQKCVDSKRSYALKDDAAQATYQKQAPSTAKKVSRVSMCCHRQRNE